MLTITSPNFPDPYPSNYQCLYSIPPCKDENDLYYVSWTGNNFIQRQFDLLTDCPDPIELISAEYIPNEQLKETRIVRLSGPSIYFVSFPVYLVYIYTLFFQRFNSACYTPASAFEISIQCGPEGILSTLPPPDTTTCMWPLINICQIKLMPSIQRFPLLRERSQYSCSSCGKGRAG